MTKCPKSPLVVRIIPVLIESETLALYLDGLSESPSQIISFPYDDFCSRHAQRVFRVLVIEVEEVLTAAWKTGYFGSCLYL